MHLREAKISALNYTLVLYCEPICARFAILPFSSLYKNLDEVYCDAQTGQCLTSQLALTKTERPVSGSQGCNLWMCLVPILTPQKNPNSIDADRAGVFWLGHMTKEGSLHIKREASLQMRANHCQILRQILFREQQEAFCLTWNADKTWKPWEWE